MIWLLKVYYRSGKSSMLIQNICEGKNVTPANDWIGIQSILDNQNSFFTYTMITEFVFNIGTWSHLVKYFLIQDLSTLVISVKTMISNAFSCSVLNWNLCVTSNFWLWLITSGLHSNIYFCFQGNNKVSMAIMKNLTWMWQIMAIILDP